MEEEAPEVFILDFSSGEGVDQGEDFFFSDKI
jgi:hypothetical protein